MKRYPRIIFFTRGVVPSTEAYVIAEGFGANVVFRNANHIPETGCLERCDGVTGDVPARYKEKYRDAEIVIEEFEAAREKALKDAKAPKVQTPALPALVATIEGYSKMKASDKKNALETAVKEKFDFDLDKRNGVGKLEALIIEMEAGNMPSTEALTTEGDGVTGDTSWTPNA